MKLKVKFERGDVVKYYGDPDEPAKFGIYLDTLHTGRHVIVHTGRDGTQEPLLRTDVEMYASSRGEMPEYAPMWAHSWGVKSRGVRMIRRA